MNVVIDAKLSIGSQMIDVFAEQYSWDVANTPTLVGSKTPTSKHIEVKGRVKGNTTITMTKNEILYELNQADKLTLSIVLVDDDNNKEPFYVHQSFIQEPNWAAASKNIDLNASMMRVKISGESV